MTLSQGQISKKNIDCFKLTNCNSIRIPLHREHTATLRIKVWAIRRPAPLRDPAASIIID